MSNAAVGNTIFISHRFHVVGSQRLKSVKYKIVLFITKWAK